MERGLVEMVCPFSDDLKLLNPKHLNVNGNQKEIGTPLLGSQKNCHISHKPRTLFGTIGCP